MEHSDVVIIGGVACGPKTAAVLARRLPHIRITLFQREERVSYGTCGLPYFASGDINSFEELTYTPYGIPRTPEFFKRSKGFTVITGTEVTAINPKQKSITIKDLKSGETFEHGYDKLVLATGATPSAPPFPVATSERIRSFTRPDDAIAFRKLAQEGKIEKTVVVGGGFIGCEMTEAAGGLWGIDVTLIEKEDQLLPYVLDPEMARLVEAEVKKQGVTLMMGAEVERIDVGGDGKPTVSVKGRDRIHADFVFLCLGVRPEVSLARSCGLDIGSTGGIAVGASLHTSDEHIYAGGDCVELVHQVSGKSIYMPMGSIANRHGRVIAENLVGNEVLFPPVVGTFFLKVFDINVATVGLPQRAAAVAHIKTEAVWGSFPDKPDYYPESAWYSLKMIYSPDFNQLLGLQAVGAGDVCRPVDVFSAFLQKEGTIDDLVDFEHGYAPPYSDALNPLYHLATIVKARLRGLAFVGPGLQECELGKYEQFLDVRETEEVEAQPWKFAGSGGESSNPAVKVIHIPLNDLVERLGELDPRKRTLLLCKRGMRSYQASHILRQAGFPSVEILAGGLQTQV
jgi:NADPH-dependent 2,4-dienoyl-CoA reductase/sulfur reductase-like enzyme/rhodanese-related sulfurtransferase